MIDIATYKQMHDVDSKKGVQHNNPDDLGAEAMARENAPSNDSFLLCLPTVIPGFNMNKKEWSKLPFFVTLLR